jgi:hypothetical protein
MSCDLDDLLVYSSIEYTKLVAYSRIKDERVIYEEQERDSFFWENVLRQGSLSWKESIAKGIMYLWMKENTREVICKGS